jgi:DNA-binding NarL/FixJ family response regulator
MAALALRRHCRRVPVLVVDDSPELRVRVCQLLRDALVGHDVLEAGDADEALALVYAHGPHVVILDINMPGRSGLAILPLIKSAPSAPTVLVLTNDPSEPRRRECMARGASHFFDKSRDFDRVVEVVRALSDAFPS